MNAKRSLHRIVLVIFLCSGLNVLAQDSLFVGQTFEFKPLRTPICIRGGSLVRFEKVQQPFFDSLATFIQNNPQAKFDLLVHSDSRGSEEHNLSMTEDIAKDLKYNLGMSGADTNRVTSIGAGELYPRKVWLIDSVYFREKPKNNSVVEVQLMEKYINSFRQKDRKRFEMLHAFNRRLELVVSELDEDIQSKVNYQLYLKAFYGDRNVVLIGPSTIKHNDTLVLKNDGDLFLHLVAPGTENEFTLSSMDGELIKSYNKLALGKEELIDLSKRFGKYKLTLFGDGGSGTLILDIEK